MPALSENVWRSLFIVAATVSSYLLVQEDMPLEGWAKVLIGAVNVALAALSPSRLARS